MSHLDRLAEMAYYEYAHGMGSEVAWYDLESDVQEVWCEVVRKVVAAAASANALTVLEGSDA